MQETNGVVVLDNLAFPLDESQVLKALHVREGSRHVETVQRLIEEATAIGRPRAIYRLGFIDEKGEEYVLVNGTKFSSRILRVNLDHAQRCFAYIGTAGRELDEWAASKTDMIVQYYADAINEAILHSSRRSLDAHLQERFAIGKMSQMNPGSLPDWPLREQRVLFSMMGDTKESIGVELLDSMLMTPAKTVSGIMFPTEETFASCQLCPRPSCPNRRAPYDRELYAKKYGETVG